MSENTAGAPTAKNPNPKKTKAKTRNWHVTSLSHASLMWLTTTSEEWVLPNYRESYVIYDGAFFSHTVDTGPVLWEGRGGERREGVRGKREKLNERETERNWGEPPQQNFSKLDNRLASLLFYSHGCWVPAKITSAVYISGGESREGGGVLCLKRWII